MSNRNTFDFKPQLFKADEKMLGARAGLSLDHEKLTYPSGGRDHRLTDVYGNVVKAILA